MHAQEKSVVRWTDRPAVRWTDHPAITVAIDLGRKATKQTKFEKKLAIYKFKKHVKIASMQSVNKVSSGE